MKIQAEIISTWAEVSSAKGLRYRATAMSGRDVIYLYSLNPPPAEYAKGKTAVIDAYLLPPRKAGDLYTCYIH